MFSIMPFVFFFLHFKLEEHENLIREADNGEQTTRKDVGLKRHILFLL